MVTALPKAWGGHCSFRGQWRQQRCGGFEGGSKSKVWAENNPSPSMTQISVLVPTMLMDSSCNRHAIHYIHGDLIHCFWHLRMDQNMDQNISNIKTYKLVGGLEHVLFLHILGMLSSQLTNSYVFQRGWNHQPVNLSYPGWCFGTWILFSIIYGIIPTPLTFVFFRGVGQPPTSYYLPAMTIWNIPQPDIPCPGVKTTNQYHFIFTISGWPSRSGQPRSATTQVGHVANGASPHSSLEAGLVTTV